MIEPLALFHRKTLRGILNLSKYASTPAIHFILGELPIEGKIHRDVFSLFFSIWRNPDSKIYKIVKHILETSQENSRTWAIHVRYLSEKYGLPDPLDCLKSEPPSKNQYTEYVYTKISAYFEKSLREKAENNSSMKFLNVSLTGLRGRRHPALSNIMTTHEVKKARTHIKMLLGDYLTFYKKSTRSGGPSSCRCCSNTTSMNETLTHIPTQCDAYEEIRKQIFPEFSQVCRESRSGVNFHKIVENAENLTQFILDPSSINLTPRISMNDPVLDKLF